jgi:hypothetical protein
MVVHLSILGLIASPLRLNSTNGHQDYRGGTESKEVKVKDKVREDSPEFRVRTTNFVKMQLEGVVDFHNSQRARTRQEAKREGERYRKRERKRERVEGRDDNCCNG